MPINCLVWSANKIETGKQWQEVHQTEMCLLSFTGGKTQWESEPTPLNNVLLKLDIRKDGTLTAITWEEHQTEPVLPNPNCCPSGGICSRKLKRNIIQRFHVHYPSLPGIQNIVYYNSCWSFATWSSLQCQLTTLSIHQDCHNSGKQFCATAFLVLDFQQSFFLISHGSFPFLLITVTRFGSIPWKTMTFISLLFHPKHV